MKKKRKKVTFHSVGGNIGDLLRMLGLSEEQQIRVALIMFGIITGLIVIGYFVYAIISAFQSLN